MGSEVSQCGSRAGRISNGAAGSSHCVVDIERLRVKCTVAIPGKHPNILAFRIGCGNVKVPIAVEIARAIPAPDWPPTRVLLVKSLLPLFNRRTRAPLLLNVTISIVRIAGLHDYFRDSRAYSQNLSSFHRAGLIPRASTVPATPGFWSGHACQIIYHDTSSAIVLCRGGRTVR
jgi:hypothetical protein